MFFVPINSSYITNLDAQIVQHIEYVPFGEVFIEERNNSWNTPYLFNGKELDEETGLYYYGARYYNPRESVWLSVDPMAEKDPNLSPYNYSLQNPIRFIDPDGNSPDDIIYLNADGSIKKVVQDGKAGIRIIEHDGKEYSMSSYQIDSGLIYWNNGNRQKVANIAGYYGTQVGVTGIGATNSGGEGEQTLAHYSSNDNGVWITPNKGGYVSSLLNNKYNLQNVLIHENYHKQDNENGIETTFASHAKVYVKQALHETFAKTSKEFQQGQVASLINYLNASNPSEVKELVKEFNDNNKVGWKIGDHIRSGYGWEITHEGEVRYILPMTLKDPH